jgi:hypothetical protein
MFVNDEFVVGLNALKRIYLTMFGEDEKRHETP